MSQVVLLGGRIPMIRVQGALYERGLQQGRALTEMIRSRVGRALSHNTGPADLADAVRVADKVEAVVERRLPEVLQEMQGIAEGAGVPWADMRVAVLAGGGGRRYLSTSTCSVFAATRAATIDGRLIIGAGGDLNPPILTDQDFFVRQVRPDEGFRYVTMGVFPERPIQPEGMNEKGLTVVGAGQTPSDGARAYREDLPVGLSLYESQQWIYTECATVEDALRVLRDSPRGYTGRTMIIGDAGGEWVKVEVTYDHMEVFRPQPDARFPANFVTAGVSGTYVGDTTYPLIASRGRKENQWRRYDRYMTLLTHSAGQIDLNFAKGLLRDHDGHPGSASICKHEEGATLDAYIFEPERRRAWVLKGRPCENQFFEVPAEPNEASSLPVAPGQPTR